MEESDDDSTAFEKDTVEDEKNSGEVSEPTAEGMIARVCRKYQIDVEEIVKALGLKQSIRQHEREGATTNCDQAIASALQARWAADGRKASEITSFAQQMLDSGARKERQQEEDEAKQPSRLVETTVGEGDKKRKRPTASEGENFRHLKSPRLTHVSPFCQARSTPLPVEPPIREDEAGGESQRIQQVADAGSANEQWTGKSGRNRQSLDDNQGEGSNKPTGIFNQYDSTQDNTDRELTLAEPLTSPNGHLQVRHWPKALLPTAFINPDPEDLAMSTDIIKLIPATPPEPQDWRRPHRTRERLNTNMDRIYTESILPDDFIDDINAMLDYIYNWPEEDAQEIMRSFQKDRENKGRRVSFQACINGGREWTVRIQDDNASPCHPRIWPNSHKLAGRKRPTRFDWGPGKLPKDCAPACPRQSTAAPDGEGEREQKSLRRPFRHSELIFPSIESVLDSHKTCSPPIPQTNTPSKAPIDGSIGQVASSIDSTRRRQPPQSTMPLLLLDSPKKPRLDLEFLAPPPLPPPFKRPLTIPKKSFFAPKLASLHISLSSLSSPSSSSSSSSSPCPSSPSQEAWSLNPAKY